MSTELKIKPNDVPNFADALSAQEKSELLLRVRSLSILDTRKSTLALTIDWTVVAGSILAAVLYPSWIVSLLAIFLIGSRQHALCLLMHDGAHGRLAKKALLNYAISDFLCAYPLFLTTSKYRDSHLAHHRNLNTDDDPDWMLRRGKLEWTFPKSKWRVLTILAQQMIGLNTLHMLGKLYRFGMHNKTVTHAMQVSRAKKIARVGYYITLFGSIHLLGGWSLYLTYWVLPAFTVLPFLLRLRSLAEHFGLDWSHELNSSRNVKANFIERTLLVPHNGQYHLDHHLYPSVPFYNLPDLHEALRKTSAYCERAHISKGYLSGRTSSLLDDLSKIK